ncbi:hypothetical protein Glove_19g296 [Diversispora epigaea]|uniref:Uncharacterized protein n=1 Tax=Diversispora epigaea TaxID=1348612 RepID=A0A397JN13_9GLOM|nr:hypothetical protein Glove_19g296 [Diversispora epigaea]
MIFFTIIYTFLFLIYYLFYILFHYSFIFAPLSFLCFYKIFITPDYENISYESRSEGEGEDEDEDADEDDDEGEDEGEDEDEDGYEGEEEFENEKERDRHYHAFILNEKKCLTYAQNANKNMPVSIIDDKHFQNDFKNWTSRNDTIDKFIQDAQLNANGRGGFGTIHYARWIDEFIREFIL